MRVEVCANSFVSALEAQKGGADRIELCYDLEHGGTTPSAAAIRLAVEKLKPSGTDVFVLIRPRSGDFMYSDIELEVMQRDILFCKEHGVDGVVIGLLTTDDQIDVENTARMADLAQPMQVTFHRAFDFVADPFEALEQIVGMGIQRILTSGQKSSALEGSDLIRQLIETAKNRIIIMPGGGITSANIEAVFAKTGAKEFHLSAKKRMKHPGRIHAVENLDDGYFLTDREEVAKVVGILKMLEL